MRIHCSSSSSQFEYSKPGFCSVAKNLYSVYFLICDISVLLYKNIMTLSEINNVLTKLIFVAVMEVFLFCSLFGKVPLYA